MFKNSDNKILNSFLFAPWFLILASCNSTTSQTPTPALQATEVTAKPAEDTLTPVKSDEVVAYKGNWTPTDPSTLTFISKEPIEVRYCYKTRCSNHKADGTLDAFEFVLRGNAARNAATFKIKRSATGYDGNFQRHGRSKVYRIKFLPI